jgi:hypothetical protein
MYPLYSYSMVGQLVIPPYQTVAWLVYGTPDLTGAQSGYFGQLQNIQIASQQQISPPSNPLAVDANAIQGTPVQPTAPTVGQILVATLQPDGSIQYQPGPQGTGNFGPVDFTIGPGGGTSPQLIPAGGKYWRVYVNVIGAFTAEGAVTLNLGYFGAATLILGNAVNPACNLQVAGLQVFDVIGNWGSSALGVLATVTGLPTSGVAEIFVEAGSV